MNVGEMFEWELFECGIIGGREEAPYLVGKRYLSTFRTHPVLFTEDN